MSGDPLVSIITATYNASHILRFAIRSVLDSECQDWELIVVGDHCTDDTAEVVASFGDSRIRYINLPVNSGQQATPNNTGLQMARGKYLCYLNHDDLFLPFHLTAMLAAAERSPGSLLLAGYADVRPVPEADPDAAIGQQLSIRRAGPTQEAPGYQPRRWQIASSWFMPATLARRAGPWRLESQTYVTPSQDWLFRAWRQGIPVVGIPAISVIAVCSGGRRDFFSRQQDEVHAYVYERYVSDRSNDAELDALAGAWSGPRHGLLRRALRKLYDATVCRLSVRLGYHPNSLEMRMRFGGPGGFIRDWRRSVSLD